jgi:hypothetical protein
MQKQRKPVKNTQSKYIKILKGVEGEYNMKTTSKNVVDVLRKFADYIEGLDEEEKVAILHSL